MQHFPLDRAQYDRRKLIPQFGSRQFLQEIRKQPVVSQQLPIIGGSTQPLLNFRALFGRSLTVKIGRKKL